MKSVTRLALAALLLAGCSSSEREDPSGLPDVVLIVIDTLRSDRMSCYGYPRPTTPVIDRLAEQGVLLRDVSSQSAWTLPSMVSLMSGRYLTDYRDTMQADVPTLAETFARAGYRTVGVVANVLLQPKGGYDRGFGHYDASPAEEVPGDNRTRSRTFDQLSADLERTLARALETDANGERPPLFLYLHPFDPHTPCVGQPAFAAELPPRANPPVLPADWQRRMLDTHGPPPPAGDETWAKTLTELHRRRGLYDQDVRFTDTELGRVLTRLDELGVLENAVVAIVSDHGETLFERLAPGQPERLRDGQPVDVFYRMHGAYLTEEAVRTPFVLWGAGVPSGLVFDAPVENVDLFPTLLELAGVPPRAPLHGRSLVPLFEDRGAPPREAHFSFVAHWRSVHELATDLKLILPTASGLTRGLTPQLHDLTTDPFERVNLIDERPADVTRLTTLIDDWVARHPTESDAGTDKGVQHRQLLDDLGYTGEDTGAGHESHQRLLPADQRKE